MNGENPQLVTDQPVEFENQPVRFKTSGELPLVLEESVEYTFIQ